MLVINKMDTEGAWEKFNDIKYQINNISGENCKKFNPKKINETLFSDTFERYSEDIRPENPLQFQNILPISAKQGGEIETLKEKLRNMLDILYDNSNEDNAKLLQNIQDYQREKGPTLV